MDYAQLKEVFIIPVIREVTLNNDSNWDYPTASSREIEDLMIGTYAIESDCGKYVRQINGPALGFWQMEPRTHDDIWRSYLPNKKKLTHALMNSCKFNYYIPSPDMMVDNIKYACFMARVQYLRVKEKIPLTLEGQAKYWKEYYNSPLGKYTTEDYIRIFNRFTGATKEASCFKEPVKNKESVKKKEMKQ